MTENAYNTKYPDYKFFYHKKHFLTPALVFLSQILLFLLTYKAIEILVWYLSCIYLFRCYLDIFILFVLRKFIRNDLLCFSKRCLSDILSLDVSYHFQKLSLMLLIKKRVYDQIGSNTNHILLV